MSCSSSLSQTQFSACQLLHSLEAPSPSPLPEELHRSCGIAALVFMLHVPSSLRLRLPDAQARWPAVTVNISTPPLAFLESVQHVCRACHVNFTAITSILPRSSSRTCSPLSGATRVQWQRRRGGRKQMETLTGGIPTWRVWEIPSHITSNSVSQVLSSLQSRLSVLPFRSRS